MTLWNDEFKANQISITKDISSVMDSTLEIPNLFFDFYNILG